MTLFFISLRPVRQQLGRLNSEVACKGELHQMIFCDLSSADSNSEEICSLLIPRKRVIFEKLTVTQLINKFSTSKNNVCMWDITSKFGTAIFFVTVDFEAVSSTGCLNVFVLQLHARYQFSHSSNDRLVIECKNRTK